MDNRNTVILIAVVIVEVALVIAVATLFINGSNNGGAPYDDGDDIYTLYIGLNDHDTHKDYDPEYAKEVLDKIVLKYADGFTRFLAGGGWTEEGVKICENTLVYIIAGIDKAKAHSIADDAKVALNQHSILISVTKEKTEYY